MKKYSIALIAFLLFLTIGFYLWTAILARKKSDDILAKFKEVNNSLSRRHDTIQKQIGVGGIEEMLQISSLKSGLILLIDSLKSDYENIPESSRLNLDKTELKANAMRLLRDVQQCNELRWAMVDSIIPDTIRYWSDMDRFSEERWYSTYFQNKPKEVVITYLNYLRNQVHTAKQ